jgi:hypothetical protein
MDKRRCLKIALRIDARLRAELSEGIDADRMVSEPLYARDVLLVCDAMAGTELHRLAGLYRVAALQAGARALPLTRAPLGIGRLLSALFGSASEETGRGSNAQSAAPGKAAEPGAAVPVPRAAPAQADRRATRRGGAGHGAG